MAPPEGKRALSSFGRARALQARGSGFDSRRVHQRRRKGVKKTKIRVVREDRIPAFAAWCSGSLKAKDGTVLLNVEACLGELVDEDGKKARSNRARIVVESLMHEFGHAVEEALGLRHSEMMVEKASSRFFR